MNEIPQNRTLIETLLLKAPTDYRENDIIKSIVHPHLANSVRNPHFIDFKGGYFSINTNFDRLYSARSVTIVDKLRINHYWSRDEKFLYEAKVARRGKWREGIEDVLHRTHCSNQEVDELILRFVPLLRQRLGLK